MNIFYKKKYKKNLTNPKKLKIFQTPKKYKLLKL